MLEDGERNLLPLFRHLHSLLAKLAEIGVRPHRDDLNKRAFVVWHELPDELVIEAESPATRR